MTRPEPGEPTERDREAAHRWWHTLEVLGDENEFFESLARFRAQARAEGAAEERKAVTRWLREPLGEGMDHFESLLVGCAADIERGDHLAGKGEGE